MGRLEINTEVRLLVRIVGKSGLFAIGEVSGGIHGGNCIGVNTVEDIVVFGRNATNPQ